MGQITSSFLTVLGDNGGESLVKQVSHTTDNLQSNAASFPIWDGLVGANQLANNSVELERKLSKDNTKKFLQFLFYMFYASGKTPRATLNITFKPENKVVDFVSDLKTKLLEKK